MIEVSHVSRNFGTFRAVNDVSFSIPTGQIVGLLGPNGAGKTTTMRMITGFLSPSEGKILIDGQDILADGADVCKLRQNVTKRTRFLLGMKAVTVREHIAKVGKGRDHLCRHALLPLACLKAVDGGLAHDGEQVSLQAIGARGGNGIPNAHVGIV